MTSPSGACSTKALRVVVLVFFGAGFVGHGFLEALASAADDAAVGRELFLHEWRSGDRRSHGGDGLGPLYNDTSCIACHNLGGAGGGGAANKNVEILVGPKQSGLLHLFGTRPDYERWRLRAAGQSDVLLASEENAKSGEDPSEWEMRRRVMLMQIDLSPRTRRQIPVRTTITRRNPTSLFGAGLIDDIPEAAIEAAAADHANSEVLGRVSRLPNGRIGRFGWKGQTESLRQFVRQACAAELGLEVPGHAQAADPTQPAATAAGLDLNEAECDALTAFVGTLKRPIQRAPHDPEEGLAIQRGKTAFAAVGCAACHRPTLGNVEGLYSDLLLHDLGIELLDSGQYSILTPSPTQPPKLSAPVVVAKQPAQAHAIREGALPRPVEWRTPPLWGLQTSAPYMHDGRAKTIDDAIAIHGGEAATSAKRFFKLAPDQRQDVIAFLKTLTVSD